MHTLVGLPNESTLLADEFTVGSHEELMRTFKEVRHIFGSNQIYVDEWAAFVHSAPSSDDVSIFVLYIHCVCTYCCLIMDIGAKLLARAEYIAACSTSRCTFFVICNIFGIHIIIHAISKYQP
jgi:hypothetical protein